MRSSLLPRILGVLAVQGVLALLFWLFVRFSMAKEESLAPSLLDRLDGNPGRIAVYVDDITGQLLIAGLGALALGAVLASIWLWTIQRNPPFGDDSARSKRKSWAGLLILGLVVTAGIFWLTVIGATISQFMAANVGVYSLVVALVLVLLGYWLATLVFVPDNAKVAVPLAASIRR